MQIGDKMEKLTTFLKSIKYGWIDLNGEIHYKIDKEKFLSDYRLLSPDKLSDQKIGICFDMVEYERIYLQNNNIHGQSILIVHEKDHKPTIHTFMIYQNNNKYYWIEYAFRKTSGIRSYSNIHDCLENVKREFLNENNITAPGNISLYNYEKPPYNITQQEFIKHCLSGLLLNKDYSNLKF